jgi:hypothetical protein
MDLDACITKLFFLQNTLIVHNKQFWQTMLVVKGLIRTPNKNANKNLVL